MMDHLVTGATGFIGGAIALELLDQTGATMYCLVRAEDDDLAQHRLIQSLRHAALAYGRVDLLAAIEQRCRGVAADIGRPLERPVLEMLERRIGHVWHAAGSRKWDHADVGEIEQANIRGTRNVLDAALCVGAEAFTYVSTAFVAGKETGHVVEECLPVTHPTNNLFEASKLGAEQLVAEARGRLRTRILRPSLVVGHSQTRAATTFDGIYGFIRDYREFCMNVATRLGSYLSFSSSNILAEASNPINALPVDYVARNAVRIGLSASPELVFHLTNAVAPTLGQAACVLARALGVREPRFVASTADLTLIDEALNGGLEAYTSFALFERTFDRAHTDAICGPSASTFTFDEQQLAAYVAWYLRHLDTSESQAKPIDQRVAAGNRGA